MRSQAFDCYSPERKLFQFPLALQILVSARDAVDRLRQTVFCTEGYRQIFYMRSETYSNSGVSLYPIANRKRVMGSLQQIINALAIRAKSRRN